MGSFFIPFLFLDLIYCSIDSWYSTVLLRTVNKHPISDLEMEVFCHEMNSNADISMPETPFFKLIKIMDKLVQNDFGVFDKANWKFVSARIEFVPTVFHQQLAKTLVKIANASICDFFITFFAKSKIFRAFQRKLYRSIVLESCTSKARRSTTSVTSFTNTQWRTSQ